MDVNRLALVFLGADQASGQGAEVDNPIILTQVGVNAPLKLHTRASMHLHQYMLPLVV
jgi:hypothetical protein